MENKNAFAVEDALRITATVFAIAVVLKTINVRSGYTIGSSIGELIKAYFEDYLTLEEAVLSACAYIKLFQNGKTPARNNQVRTIFL